MKKFLILVIIAMLLGALAFYLVHDAEQKLPASRKDTISQIPELDSTYEGYDSDHLYPHEEFDTLK